MACPFSAYPEIVQLFNGRILSWCTFNPIVDLVKIYGQITWFTDYGKGYGFRLRAGLIQTSGLQKGLVCRAGHALGMMADTIPMIRPIPIMADTIRVLSKDIDYRGIHSRKS